MLEEYKKKINEVLDDSEAKKFIEGLTIYLKNNYQNQPDKKVFIFANGGLQATAAHISQDLTMLCGITSLTISDVPTITAYGNDYGFHTIFTKFFEKYKSPHNNDLVILATCSGSSKNVCELARYCNSKGIDTVSLTGSYPDNVLRCFKTHLLDYYVDSRNTGIIQVAIEMLLHIVTDNLTLK